MHRYIGREATNKYFEQMNNNHSKSPLRIAIKHHIEFVYDHKDAKREEASDVMHSTLYEGINDHNIFMACVNN